MTSTPEGGAASASREAARESLSELLARILNQLSISAWLPAGALVFIGLLYGSLATHRYDLVQAVEAIGGMNFQSLVLVVAAVVLLTMATQAFEFEAIRLLEGYWGSGRVGSFFADIGCYFQIRRRERLGRRKTKLEDTAFLHAEGRMLRHNVSMDQVEWLKARHFNKKPRDGLQVTILDEEVWRQYARAGDIRRVDNISLRLQEYPSQDHRVLPTRLGNILRVHEESFYGTSQSNVPLEGSLIPIYDQLPGSWRDEHDRYRGRLDLYCSMVIVFLVAALAAGPALFQGGWAPPLIAAAGAMILVWFTYRASLASARGYGSVLDTARAFSADGSPADSPEEPTST